MEEWLSEKLGIRVKPHERTETPEEARRRRLKNARVPIGEMIVLPGQGFVSTNQLQKNARKYADADWKKWLQKFLDKEITEVEWRLFEKEYYAEREPKDGRQSYMPDTRHGLGFGMGIKKGDYTSRAAGMAGYYRDPQTGKVIWTDLPLEYQFRKRSDLSSQVWKAVEDQEQMIFDVIRGGIAAGRDVKHIAGDLEQFINYPNGGERVVGRWKGMFPDTEAGRKEALKRQFFEERYPGIQYGSDDMKKILDQEGVKEQWKSYVQHRSSSAFGKHYLPPSVKQYASRLGKAGLDYRAIRITRTELTAMLADEQLAIAEDSGICTGEMDFVMERGRDHHSCNCEKYASMNPWKVDDPERPEIPVHPSCCCQWVPRLKTDEEILADYMGKGLAVDMEAFEGSDEQKAILDAIDEAEADMNREIAERTEAEAKRLYPNENWVDASKIEFKNKGKYIEMPDGLKGVSVAQSRLTGLKNDEETLTRELKQAKILTDRGDNVHILPKAKDEKGNEIKSPDAILNGIPYEFKTIEGNINRVAEHFRHSRKQCDNVFIRISNPNITKDEAVNKIHGVLNSTDYTRGTNGWLMLHLDSEGKTYKLNISRLK